VVTRSTRAVQPAPEAQRGLVVGAFHRAAARQRLPAGAVHLEATRCGGDAAIDGLNILDDAVHYRTENMYQ